MGKKGHNKLNYRVSGNGHPVVFLHGFLESNTMWDYLNFKIKFKKIRFDLPGHGNSPLDLEQPLSISSMARDVKIQLDEMGLESYYVVGHSMGGYVALELMKMDQHCTKLVLLNSSFWEDSEEKRKERIRVADIVIKNKDLFLYESIPNLFAQPEKFNADVKQLINESRKISSEVIASVSLAMSTRKDNTALIVERKEQILIIQGNEDPVVPRDKMKCKNTMNLHYIELKKCAHMAHIESPQETVRALENFL
jgi:pimeloyl-ACP methyl ester carboxylesterase